VLELVSYQTIQGDMRFVETQAKVLRNVSVGCLAGEVESCMNQRQTSGLAAPESDKNHGEGWRRMRDASGSCVYLSHVFVSTERSVYCTGFQGLSC
jgi:hypothetical protein